MLRKEKLELLSKEIFSYVETNGIVHQTTILKEFAPSEDYTTHGFIITAVQDLLVSRKLSITTTEGVSVLYSTPKHIQ